MKRFVCSWLWTLAIPMLLLGCGGDDDDAGVLSIGITDAKPYLPENVEQVLITFDEVRVHRSGGKWTSLPLPDGQSDYTIDLYQFIEGARTQLVPPVELTAGKYTQIRLGIIEGWLVTSEETYPLDIPSENLKTNKNFYFDVVSGEAVDLTVDFDLSQSIKPKQDGYTLKPVLHLNETQRAAQIRGSIAASTFVDSEAVVTVTVDGGEEYTKLVVTKADLPATQTEFRIFWLVPNHSYTVLVEVDENVVHEEEVGDTHLEPGEVFSLNLGSPI
jgi:hypothetical protein